MINSNVARIGIVEMFAGSVLPSGALWCDGSAKNTADYPDLFSVIGYSFGGSSGTFNLPDFRSVSPIGVGTGTHRGTTPVTLGAYAGAQNHTMLASDIAAHTHINPGGLEFVVGVAPGQENSINSTPGGTSGSYGVTFSNVTGTSVPSQTTPIPTVTPSLAINFIIWAQ
jgi:microcystin-dependent protein